MGVLSLLAWVSGCAVPAPEWTQEDGYRWRPLLAAEGGEPGFRAVEARRTGIDFGNRLAPEAAVDNDHLLIGSGVALGDVNGDGRVDVYFAALDGSNRLYLNRGGFRFVDGTDEAGVGLDDRRSTGAVLADVDGDGDLDLFVTSLGGPNALLLNDGSGRFVEGTATAGVESQLGSTTSTLADIDADGDLDLYVAQYKSVSAADELLPFERDIQLTVGQGADIQIAPEHRDHFRLETRGGVAIPVERAEPDLLYLNNGHGVFQAVAAEDGRFLDAGGHPLARLPDDFGLAARFHDVDGDGDPDLYVCNDFDHPDHFWLNEGDGRFRAADWTVLRTTSYASMAVDFADVDRDGHTDIFVADMLSPDRVRRQRQRPLHRLFPKQPGVFDDVIQYQRNTLQMGRGDGTFAQVSEMAGVDASDWSWGSAFLDVDLDGWEDLLIANGHGRDMQDADALEEIVRMQGRVSWDEAKLTYPELFTANAAFRNRGDGTFERVSDRWGWGTEPDVSHGIAYGDLDGDGDLDVVVNRLGAPARVLENRSRAPRVAVALRGTARNTRGIGATVVVSATGLPDQSKEITAGGLYLSSAAPMASFAAGDAEAVDIEVRWPGGSISRLEGVPPGRVYEIDAASSRTDRSAPPAEAGATTTMFEDISDRLDHRHAEAPHDDLLEQPLLPTFTSRLGPGVSWVRTAAGERLLVLPTGRGGRMGLYAWEGERFLSKGSTTSEGDQSTALLVPGRGGEAEQLLVGLSDQELPAPERRSSPGLQGIGITTRGTFGGARSEALVEPFSAGPLSMADVDGDGDLDVFVGSRTQTGQFPLAPPSRLLLRDGGAFVESDVYAATFADLGAASGSVFSDLDSDGDQDLVVAVDGGPVTVLLNEGGLFSDATTALGMADHTGRWNGVTTGDFDGDGRPDIVATNWGTNRDHRPGPGRPIVLLHGDFDRNGARDVVRLQADDPGGPLYPIDRLERLQAAWPQLRLRFPRFDAWAGSDVTAMLRRDPRPDELLSITTVEHTLFLNRGDRFEARPLPGVAQRAPAIHAGVADLDNDGNEDLVLTQNFFATPTDRPRYDAGRGLVLLGDGTGGFRAVPGRESGIVVWGEQRGAAFSDIDMDGRTDVVVGQHASETKVFLNRTGSPGLRVILEGGPDNPWGIGASVRVRYEGGDGTGVLGPRREIRAGAGYWSSDDPVTILGLAGPPTEVMVTWPDGRRIEYPVPPGAETVRVTPSGAGG